MNSPLRAIVEIDRDSGKVNAVLPIVESDTERAFVEAALIRLQEPKESIMKAEG